MTNTVRLVVSTQSLTGAGAARSAHSVAQSFLWVANSQGIALRQVPAVFNAQGQRVVVVAPATPGERSSFAPIRVHDSKIEGALRAFLADDGIFPRNTVSADVPLEVIVAEFSRDVFESENGMGTRIALRTLFTLNQAAAKPVHIEIGRIPNNDPIADVQTPPALTTTL